MKQKNWVVTDRHAVAKLNYRIRQFLKAIAPLKIKASELASIKSAADNLSHALNAETDKAGE